MSSQNSQAWEAGNPLKTPDEIRVVRQFDGTLHATTPYQEQFVKAFGNLGMGRFDRILQVWVVRAEGEQALVELLEHFYNKPVHIERAEEEV